MAIASGRRLLDHLLRNWADKVLDLRSVLDLFDVRLFLEWAITFILTFWLSI